MQTNEETTRDTSSWQSLYNKIQGNAGNHRKTGIRLAADRKGNLEIPLGKHVSEEDAHVGAVDALVKDALSNGTPYWVELGAKPTARIAAIMMTQACRQQQRADHTPSVSVLGTQVGKRTGHEELSDTIEAHNPYADIEVSEEAAAVLSSLPERHRATLLVLMGNASGRASEVCPDDVRQLGRIE